MNRPILPRSLRWVTMITMDPEPLISLLWHWEVSGSPSVRARSRISRGRSRLHYGRPAREAVEAAEIVVHQALTRVLLLGRENTTEAARRHADLLIKRRAKGVASLSFISPIRHGRPAESLPGKRSSGRRPSGSLEPERRR